MNIDYLIENIEKITTDDFSLTPWFLDNIYPHIQPINRLGEGALGIAFNIPDSNAVIKVTTPCEKFGDLSKIYCSNMYSMDQIFHVPNNKKLLIIIANYLSEAIIGGILNRIQNYTPHFIQVHGIFFSKYYNTSYMIMEKISTDTYRKIKTKADFYLFLFQIAHALYISQMICKFTHFDLHLENVGYTDVTDIDYYQYNFNYGDTIYTIYVKNPQFLAKILDFGFSRIENDNLIINPLIDYLPIKTYSVFNPYYDFMSLIGSLLFFSKQPDVKPLATKFVNLLSTEDINELLSMIFNEPIDIQMAQDKYYNRWRPNEPDMRSTDHSFATINDIMGWLADKLISFNVITTEKPISGNTKTTDYWLFSNQYYVPERRFSGNSQIDQGIETTIDTVSNIFPWRSFNFTGDRISKFKTLTIHNIFINSQLATNNGYKFTTVCCKIDPINFMENYRGVAINGGFFDIGNSYEMLGQYRQFFRDHYYESNRSVPDLYIHYFGFVIVDNNSISISKFGQTDLSQIRNAFISGPLLIWNGVPQMTEQTLNEMRDGIKIFQCQNIHPPSDNKIVGDKFNCDHISPGELSHGSNANPRSMLVIRDDPWDIVLVVVEGRNERSDGADFLDLIEIARGLNAKHAINLDGGRSSNIAWKSPNSPNVIGVSTQINSYPVGNILAVIK